MKILKKIIDFYNDEENKPYFFNAVFYHSKIRHSINNYFIPITMKHEKEEKEKNK